MRRTLLAAVLIPALAVLAAPASPQGPEPAPSGAPPAPAASDQPIEIQADNGIEWQQEAHVYIARGNAVATRGDAEIHADTLIAYYRPSKSANQHAPAGQGQTAEKGQAPQGQAQPADEGSTEIYRVDADGNVVIKNPSRTVVGDHAVWDVDQAVGVVTGKALKMTTSVDTVTARDSFEWYDQKQIGVARGEAVATRGAKTIKADILTIYLIKNEATPGTGKPGAGKPAPAPPGAPAAKAAGKAGAGEPGKPGGGAGAPGNEDSKISRLDAQGHVVVTDPPDAGHGDYAVYNAETGICTLIGNVVIARDKDVIKGQYAVMDLNTNVDRILPASSLPGRPQERVQGLFVRQQPAAAGAGKPGAAGAPGKSP